MIPMVPPPFECVAGFRRPLVCQDMSEFFAIIPKLVLFDLLSAWLCVKEVGRLDSALCGQTNIFRSLLSMGALKCNDKSLFQCNDFVLWITKVNVALSNVCIGELLSGDEKLRSALLRSIKNSLRSVEITAKQGEVETALVAIPTTITCLESLTIHREAFPSVLLLLARNPKLKCLHLSEPKDILPQVACFTTHLIDLALDRSLVSQESLNSLLTHCSPQLGRLVLPNSVCSDRDWLNGLFAKCPSMRELHLGKLCIYPVNLWKPSVAPNLVAFQCMLGSINEPLMIFLGRGMPNLQTLFVFTGDVGVNERPKSFHVCDKDLNLVLTHFKHLRQLVTNLDCVGMQRGHPLPPLPIPLTTAASTIPIPLTTAASTAQRTHALEELYICCERKSINMTDLLVRCPLLTSIGVDMFPILTFIEEEKVYREREINLYACICAGVKKVVITRHVRCMALKMVCNLEELVILNCDNIDEYMLTLLATNNPLLRVLHLERVGDFVTYQCLTNYLRVCPQLRSVVFNFVKSKSISVGKGNQGGELVHHLVRELYPYLEKFECNIVT